VGNREASLQASIVSWIRILPSVFVYAVPNGHLVTKREAALRRWTGVRAGVPDLCIVHPGGACFLECKLGGTKPTPEQAEVMDTLQSLGAPCAVVRSLEEAQQALLAWGVIDQSASAATFPNQPVSHQSQEAS
jgi:hypothetical protein